MIVIIKIIIAIIRSHFNGSVIYWLFFSNFTGQDKKFACVYDRWLLYTAKTDIGVTNNCMILTLLRKMHLHLNQTSISSFKPQKSEKKTKNTFIIFSASKALKYNPAALKGKQRN